MSDPLTRAAIEAHREWLGFVQPVGLVVAEPVLVERGVILDRHARPRQERFKELLDADDQHLTDVRALFTAFLGWEADDLAEPADELHVRLPELGVTLEPTFAVADPDGGTQLLIRLEPDGADLDAPVPERVDGWTASPQARSERLLRQAEIPTGLLCTPQAIRLVHAPKGETSGHVTFPVAHMATVMGRPILAALDLLLGEFRLFRAPARERLPALLEASREAQNTVSTRLARQVLGSLYELLRGFVAADARDPDHRLQTLARQRPEDLYGGLVTALMRLVFILYVEDRDLMPQDPVYEQHYGLRGLFAKVREDAARHGDLMDRRYGAWAHLLALFRLIHKGGGHGERLRFTARKGRLFDPDAYPFLEGRASAEDVPERLPMVPDGTVWRVLERLLVLDGERLSYRTLDVEQIGSVYEVVMGFRIELAGGRSLALRTKAKHGAAVVVDLDALLATAPDKRAKALADLEVAKLTDRETRALKAAESVQELADALARKVDEDATPDLVPAAVPVLQPTDERRRSGSHYTPRSLTQPIVAETLRPILERLGPKVMPEQILDLKVLDPAMGSGAFLVEACRQLAEALVKAWEVHGTTPDLPADEDALLYAKRQIAQRCLYGVDKNAMAAELGKLSLWLATLAKDHEFTFLDHAIRHGDSLVGLDRAQLEALHWAPDPKERQSNLMSALVRERLRKIEAERARIRAAVDGVSEEDLREILANANLQLDDPKLIGDAVVAAFFAADRARQREEERLRVRAAIEMGGPGWQERVRPLVTGLRTGEKPVVPFHWPLEFPEVFDRDNPGFDAIVGNPPFAGKNTMAASHHEAYPDWLKTIHEGAHGNADIVAHFYRRAFGLLREGGCFGLLATNTIRQGDTRATGLRPIREAGGTIYSAVRRRKWPGEGAAVVVCVVHIARGKPPGPYRLDNREVPVVTAFLFHAGGDDDPVTLTANANKSFVGSYVLGTGFTFDDTDTRGVSSPIAHMHELIAKDARNAERIFPYIGGEEVNDSPIQAHHRYVINFEHFPLRRDERLGRWAKADERQRHAWLRAHVVPTDYPGPVAHDWLDLLAIIEQKVKPTRLRQASIVNPKRWWMHARSAADLYAAIAPLDRVLVRSLTSAHFSTFTSLQKGFVYDQTLLVFALPEFSSLACLSGRVHEVWASFFGATLEDRGRYNLQDCFETFPFPEGFETDPRLEEVGKEYYEFRAGLMVQNDEGLTKTYNRFHDPDERSNAIHELRRLHDAMDRAVLDAYGWSDLRPTCDFELEWEDDEDELDGRARRRRKPWRYRWPEEVRDEVLARLLALNKERAEQERLELGDARRRRA